MVQSSVNILDIERSGILGSCKTKPVTVFDSVVSWGNKREGLIGLLSQASELPLYRDLLAVENGVREQLEGGDGKAEI